MKIVFLCRLFYPHIGGVEKHVIEISTRLIKKGYDVSVVTESLANTKDFEVIKGIKVYRINVGRNDTLKKLRIWKEMWRLQKIIQEADIVHCHDVFFWYLPFRFLYPHIPVYTTFHGYESYPITQSSIRIRKLSEKLSLGNICIGDFIPKWYGTKSTFISYGAVDTKKIKEVRVKIEDKNSALFIGRLDEQTGILTYAKAVEILKKKYPKFDFMIVGDGKYKSLLEKNFNVFGFQKYPEKYFQQYHFAFVSRYLSILESFAARRLVFAVYDNPVKEDYLKMAPYAEWIVIEEDSGRLAEKIKYFLKHPKEEKEITDKAYLWVKEQTWEKMVEIYLKLWN